MTLLRKRKFKYNMTKAMSDSPKKYINVETNLSKDEIEKRLFKRFNLKKYDFGYSEKLFIWWDSLAVLNISLNEKNDKTELKIWFEIHPVIIISLIFTGLFGIVGIVFAFMKKDWFQLIGLTPFLTIMPILYLFMIINKKSKIKFFQKRT